jgi:hypothetical protein
VVRGQQPALRFGTASIDFPPRLDQDLLKAAQAGVKLVLCGTTRRCAVFLPSAAAGVE